MKLINNLLVIFMVFFLLVGCETSSNIIYEVPNENNEENPKIDEEDPIVEDNNCKANSELVVLNSTSTLNAEFLWNNSISCVGLELVDGVIQYKEGITEASLTTSIFSVEQFEELVPSWNIIIDNDVKIRVKVSVGNKDSMSEEFILGYWTLNYKTSISNQINDYARINIDTLISQDISLDQISFTITFENGNFMMKNLSFTTVPTNSIWIFDETVLLDYDVFIPAKQQLSIPVIGNSICSPTSLAMVLAYYDQDLNPSDVAGFVRDQGASIYGNWSFNASYAGGFENLFSRVEYIHDFSTVLSYLSKDIPLVLSIKTSSSNALEGTIMAYPAGHLIVLHGLKYENDSWYALVNDPAEYTDEAVIREYLLFELISAWNGYSYILSNQEIE